jgi:signal transduction histidine kinase
MGAVVKSGMPWAIHDRGLVALAVASLALGAAQGPAAAAPDHAQVLQIQGATVDGRTMSWRAGKTLNLGTSPRNIAFRFGTVADNPAHPLLRLRTKLEGFDHDWHEGGGEMFVTMRFYNASGDVVGQQTFTDHDESPGWTGSLETSTFIHRREAFTAPPDAARLWAIVSSAGGPGTVGTFVIDNLIVARLGAAGGQELLRTPTAAALAALASTNIAPEGWVRDGTSPSMARVVEVGRNGGTRDLALMDDDALSHAEWHNTRDTAAVVKPNDKLLAEWNEMHSIGIGDYRAALYESLPPGNYTFKVAEYSILGAPTGREASVSVRVPEPFWRSTWFWVLAAVAALGAAALAARYVAAQKIRRAMARLEQQRALEQERLRIARDIHDDLGARVTEISMLSAMAQSNGAFPEKARQEFERITLQSRELVAALYETVWAVNPQNDNLEALGNYLRQRINQQCTQAGLRCRLRIAPLPPVEVSSRARHNLSMAAREAMHNVIKHACASQVTVQVDYDGGVLLVSLQDDGCGFQMGSEVDGGHGLGNMRRRLEEIGGGCSIDSVLGAGTTVVFRAPIAGPLPPPRTEKRAAPALECAKPSDKLT